MIGGMKLPELPVKKQHLDHITKVTFTTEDGRTFTFFSTRVWRLDFNGNLAYQILGENPDLLEVLPAVVKPEEGEKK